MVMLCDLTNRKAEAAAMSRAFRLFAEPLILLPLLLIMSGSHKKR